MQNISSGYSIYSIVSDGSTMSFPVQFSMGMLRASYVRVYVEGEVDGSGEQIYRSWELQDGDPGIINVLGATVPAGKLITFRRSVDLDHLIHQYSNGSILDYPSLDESHEQLIMAIHELADGIGLKDVQVDLNMHGNTIRGIGIDETDPTSAATVGYTIGVKNEAQAAANTATAQAVIATAKADESTVQADRAEDEADEAAASALDSGASALESHNSSELSRKWAENPEDVPVVPGHFSAMHWAIKAEQTLPDNLVQRVTALEDGITITPTGSKVPRASEAGKLARDWLANATQSEHGTVRVATKTDVESGAVPEGSPAVLAVGTEAYESFIPAFMIGGVFPFHVADGYVPNGCVPPDAAEYAESQFPTFYNDFLLAGRIITCTYAEFAAQVAATGNCAKFALDPVARKFKVPLYKDGDSITQATSAAEIGKSTSAGLPNLTGEISNLAASVGALSSTGVLKVKNEGTTTYATNVTKTEYTRIAIDASRDGTDAIYGKSNTVTTEGIRLRHFVVLASGQNNASIFDWSNYMATLAGKANLDFNNITPVGKANAGRAMAKALDYDHPVSFAISDSGVNAPVEGLMVGWFWMDPGGPTNDGTITVGNTQVAATLKNMSPISLAYPVAFGVRVKKAVGIHVEEVVIVPWKVV